jgi:AcrR family transcriptional regulator
VAAQAASRPDDRADRSRRAILDAAAPVFTEQGYAGASLNAIIRASGLTKGGFYFHFASKLDLALALIDDANERWRRRVAAEASGPRAVDRFYAVPRVLVRMTAEGDGPASLRKLIDELALDPELRDRVCGSIREWIESVAEQVREVQAEGGIREDVDPQVLAEVAVGGFVGMQTISEQLGDDGFERRVEALIRVVRAAVTPGAEGGT